MSEQIVGNYSVFVLRKCSGNFRGLLYQSRPFGSRKKLRFQWSTPFYSVVVRRTCGSFHIGFLLSYCWADLHVTNAGHPRVAQRRYQMCAYRVNPITTYRYQIIFSQIPLRVLHIQLVLVRTNMSDEKDTAVYEKPCHIGWIFSNRIFIIRLLRSAHCSRLGAGKHHMELGHQPTNRSKKTRSGRKACR